MPDRRLARASAQRPRKRWFDTWTYPRPSEREDDPAAHNERITLIEFVWVSPTGVQPVLFLERELLQ